MGVECCSPHLTHLSSVLHPGHTPVCSYINLTSSLLSYVYQSNQPREQARWILVIQMSSRTAQLCAKMDVASTPTLAAKDSAQFVIKNLLSRLLQLACRPHSVHLPLPPAVCQVSVKRRFCLPVQHPVCPELSPPFPSSVRLQTERRT